LGATESDKRFAGSIPQLYERYLVPLIFEPYALELAQRLSAHPVERVLEIAAGTGALTRSLASELPEAVAITATDLNQPMLDMAASIGTSRPVEWRRADALRLPFPDQSFDAVVCQFGIMFMPDKAKAFSEAKRVLRPGGVLLFSVWDRIEENELADVVTSAVGRLFPADPPGFLARTPHGYHDLSVIKNDLAGGGFDATPAIVTLAARSPAPTARVPAVAYCEGTPMRNEIEERDASRLAEATDVAEAAVAERFGPGPLDARIQAHIFEVRA
jgi:SAM-dependent methyltransferase